MTEDTAALDDRFRRTPLATSGAIHTLVLRKGGGVHEQPHAITLSPVSGIVGDRWALAGPKRHPEAQVTLIERRVAALLTGDPSRWHIPGDNVVVDLDLSFAALPVGARLAAGGVVLEITAKPHAGCDKFRERLGGDALRWVNARGNRGLRLRGVNARILVGGTLRRGDHLQRV
jgi:MOSC domain-containing protein YiiM